MITLGGALILMYLIVGYGWVRVFTTCILDNKRWDDTGDFGPFSAIVVNVFWLPMVVIILMYFIMWFVLNLFSSESIREFYGLNPKGK